MTLKAGNRRTFDMVLYDNQVWEVEDFSKFTKKEITALRNHFFCPGLISKDEFCGCPLTPKISSKVSDDEVVSNQLWFSKHISSEGNQYEHKPGCIYINEKVHTVTRADLLNTNIIYYLRNRLFNEFRNRTQPSKKPSKKEGDKESTVVGVGTDVDRVNVRARIESPQKLVLSSFIHPDDYEEHGIIGKKIYYFRIEMLFGGRDQTNNTNLLKIGFKTNSGNFFDDYIVIELPYLNAETFRKYNSLRRENPVQVACVGTLKLVESTSNGNVYNKLRIVVDNEDLIHIE